MSKRVRLPIPVRVNETSFRVLQAIAAHALASTGLRCGPALMSHRQIRAAVPVSEQTVMRSCGALREGGMLTVRPNHLENGGQYANTYELTALGLEVLRQGEELGRANPLEERPAGAGDAAGRGRGLEESKDPLHDH